MECNQTSLWLEKKQKQKQKNRAFIEQSERKYRAYKISPTKGVQTLDIEMGSNL